MTENSTNVLFLCTGNSARSIIAEAILAKHGKGRYQAFSAGSFPKGEVHPYAIELLKTMGYESDGCRSKSWDEFSGPGAPKMDLIITVCDSASNEVCPIWPGQPIAAHWGIADPAAAEGTIPGRRSAFMDAFRILADRVSALVKLPIEALDRSSLQGQLDEIGQISSDAT